jgi:hypothetical protein
MASSGRGWFGKKGTSGQRPLRVLTASSRRLDLNSKTEAKQLRALRQGWQSDAWNYRDSIGELRYALQFLANSASRMRLFVAAEPIDGESDNPIPLDKVADIPEDVLSIATQAMLDLGRGRMALKGLLKALSTNISVAGECFLLGQQNPETGEETWSIRSVDEIVVKDEGYEMREIPDGPQGIIPWVKLDPELTVVSRIWIPHPRFDLIADSPMRAMLDDLESLSILRRMIRSDGRSRLGRGVLFVPDELSIKVAVDDDEDPQADPFMASFTQALMEPISDEGVASAVVPIVIRGPGEAGEQIKHIPLAQPFEEQAAKAREELVGIIATSLDLPREVIMGIADLNHWSAWSVSDETFRHHIEPHVIECCDALTGAYLRPYLVAAGVPVQWARRIVFWYDPTELVTHPDQTKDGLELHDRLVISDEAMLRTAGFTDVDKPSKQEIQVRLLEKMRTWPPNLVMAFLHAWDPTLIAPPITVAGTIPGIKPGGVDTGEPPATGLMPGVLPPPTPAPTTAELPKPESSAEEPEPGPPPITAAGAAQSARLSRKLAGIDRDLRAKLQTAANAAMHRQLERAGAKLRTKVAKDETLRTKIAHRPNERVSAILGQGLVAASGLSNGDLIGDDWNGLRGQFFDWTAAAQKQAIATAIRMGSLSEEDSAVKAAEAAMDAGRDAGWDVLSTALTNLGHHLLYNPDPNVGPGEWADLNPDTLVPTGTIRTALGVAGGGDAGVIPGSESTVALGQPIGQIGTGSTITELLSSSGLEQDSYEWDHGPSLDPFEPHLELDGVEFSSFDSEVLANGTGFPDNAYYFPGDHQGCACDFTPLWVQAEQTGSADGGGQSSE